MREVVLGPVVAPSAENQRRLRRWGRSLHKVLLELHVLLLRALAPAAEWEASTWDAAEGRGKEKGTDGEGGWRHGRNWEEAGTVGGWESSAGSGSWEEAGTSAQPWKRPRGARGGEKERLKQSLSAAQRGDFAAASQIAKGNSRRNALF